MPALGRFRYLDVVPRGAPSPRGTVVLLHAFPLTADLWEPQLTLAEAGWRVVAPHLRGFDGAPNDPPASSIDEYASDVLELLDALQVGSSVVGGLSMGGYVAFELMRRAPRLVRALVLADTRAEGDTPEALAGRRRMLQLVEERGAAAVADEMVPKLLGPSTRATRPELVEQVRALVLANRPEAIAGAVRAMMGRPDSTPLLATIRCPVLIAVGEEDQLTPPQLSEAMHRAIPGSELVVVAGAGHLSSLEQPAGFNKALEGFLRRC